MPLRFEPMPRARAPLATFPTQPSFRAGGTVPQALPRHPALHGLPQATGEPSALQIAVGRTRSPHVAGKWWQREGISPGAEWALRERQLRSPGKEEMSGRGWAWARETGEHQSARRARGPGGAEIQALPQGETSRAAPAGVESPLAALGPPRGPRYPAAGPDSAAAVETLPRRAYLGHGCLPLGPALGHRGMPRGAGHGRRGGIAPNRRSPPPAPGLRERAGRATPATGLGDV